VFQNAIDVRDQKQRHIECALELVARWQHTAQNRVRVHRSPRRTHRLCFGAACAGAALPHSKIREIALRYVRRAVIGARQNCHVRSMRCGHPNQIVRVKRSAARLQVHNRRTIDVGDVCTVLSTNAKCISKTSGTREESGEGGGGGVAGGCTASECTRTRHLSVAFHGLDCGRNESTIWCRVAYTIAFLR
jgi:hypothetical protein